MYLDTGIEIPTNTTLATAIDNNMLHDDHTTITVEMQSVEQDKNEAWMEAHHLFTYCSEDDDRVACPSREYLSTQLMITSNDVNIDVDVMAYRGTDDDNRRRLQGTQQALPMTTTELLDIKMEVSTARPLDRIWLV